jgi:hypothetical protein
VSESSAVFSIGGRGRSNLFVSIIRWQATIRDEPSGAKAQPEADPPLAEMGLVLATREIADLRFKISHWRFAI